MELWIRSQDKSKIVKVNELYSSLQEDFGTGKFGIYSSNTNYYQKERPLLLGNYKTKERALEVLNEIQCHLVNINDNRDSYFYVYEMPKE